MKKILITGGAGFIGSNLARRLLEEKYKVMIIDDLSNGKIENIPEGAEFFKGSITNKKLLEEVFSNHQFECVFHLAALPRVQFSIENPEITHDVNVNGTFYLLDACRRHGVGRFVFSSSSSVYGNQKELPLKEEMTPNPMSPYALHKLIGEQYCKIFNFLYGIKSVSLRYFNVYGKGQSSEGAYALLIPKFVEKVSNGETPVINGSGEQTRDFTHVEDVVEANILAMLTKNERCFGNAFNIGASNNKSVNMVAKEIISILGREGEITPEHGPPVIEPKDTLASINKAKDFLGWEPKVSFERGLKKMILD